MERSAIFAVITVVLGIQHVQAQKKIMFHSFEFGAAGSFSLSLPETTADAAEWTFEYDHDHLEELTNTYVPYYGDPTRGMRRVVFWFDAEIKEAEVNGYLVEDDGEPEARAVVNATVLGFEENDAVVDEPTEETNTTLVLTFDEPTSGDYRWRTPIISDENVILITDELLQTPIVKRSTTQRQQTFRFSHGVEFPVTIVSRLCRSQYSDCLATTKTVVSGQIPPTTGPPETTVPVDEETTTTETPTRPPQTTVPAEETTTTETSTVPETTSVPSGEETTTTETPTRPPQTTVPAEETTTTETTTFPEKTETTTFPEKTETTTFPQETGRKLRNGVML